jgi:hypothetical protein
MAWLLGIACQLQQSSLWPESSDNGAAALAVVLLLASGWLRVGAGRHGSLIWTPPVWQASS